MENLKKPAFPTEDIDTNSNGLTKLEYASIKIAAGLVSKYSLNNPADQSIIARLSVELAQEVLKEANK